MDIHVYIICMISTMSSNFINIIKSDIYKEVLAFVGIYTVFMILF